MSAVTAEALMPFPLASSANCCFHASKPAAVLPHCAAPALLAVHASAKAVAAMILSCPPLVIQNSFTLDAANLVIRLTRLDGTKYTLFPFSRAVVHHRGQQASTRPSYISAPMNRSPIACDPRRPTPITELCGPILPRPSRSYGRCLVRRADGSPLKARPS